MNYQSILVLEDDIVILFFGHRLCKVDDQHTYFLCFGVGPEDICRPHRGIQSQSSSPVYGILDPDVFFAGVCSGVPYLTTDCDIGLVFKSPFVKDKDLVTGLEQNIFFRAVFKYCFTQIKWHQFWKFLRRGIPFDQGVGEICLRLEILCYLYDIRNSHSRRVFILSLSHYISEQIYRICVFLDDREYSYNISIPEFKGPLLHFQFIQRYIKDDSFPVFKVSLDLYLLGICGRFDTTRKFQRI